MNNKGKHLIIDCKNVSRDVCLDDKAMVNALSVAVQKAGATILSTSRYHLGHNSPPGFACIIMLDESHCSAHSYADEGMIAMDVFTCGNTDPLTVLEYVRELIDLGDCSYQMVGRFISDEVPTSFG